MNETPEEEYKQIQSFLKPTTKVSSYDFGLGRTFSIVFRQIFWCDPPNYRMTDGNYGATRTSWTYHTAIAIAEASKVLILDCKFEALGRRDAVIETKDEKPEIVMIAEWEWNYNDIFGKGKELEKLKDSCKQYKSADAFLLTYLPREKYSFYLQKIVEYWMNSNKRRKNPPTLFLHTVIFDEDKRMREFQSLRTAEITCDETFIWNDLDF